MSNSVDTTVQLLQRASSQEKFIPYSAYGYLPTFWICTIFLVLFAVTTVLHIGQAIYHRTWFMLITACACGLAEVIGWSGRTWSSQHLLDRTPFLMQISTTILGPTPLLAANFVILGRIITTIGERFNRMKPLHYSVLFITCDVISLIVQAVGGGMASAATTLPALNLGSQVMLGGIAFQMAVMFAFTVMATEFLFRSITNKPVSADLASKAEPIFTRNMKYMLGGMCFTTVLLFIRAIYRTLELSQGWKGHVNTTEIYFNVLDGAMIVLAMYTLNFIHPGRLLESQTAAAEGESYRIAGGSPDSMKPSA